MWRQKMHNLGIRYLLHGQVVQLFMDAGWERRAEKAGLKPGVDYDTVQVLTRKRGFDEWITQL